MPLQFPDSATVTNAEIESTIKRCHDENGYSICPHTAVAVKYHYDHPIEPRPRVVIATASSAKFPEALEKSGVEVARSEEIERLLKAPVKFEKMDKGQDWTKMLREKIEDIAKKNKAN